MLRLTSRYATALLEYAEENGLELVYRQALMLMLSGHPEEMEVPEVLGKFLEHVPADEKAPVLYRFLDLARKRMDLMAVEVISVVPLTDEQLLKLERKLIKMFHKQMEISTSIDPSLLGGLRIIVDNTVIDDTVKRKLSDMKNSVYKGVYFKQ